MTTRRFPPPWSVEELDACFVVRDHSGQQLAYVYFEDEPRRLQHDGDEPKTLCNGCVVVELETEGGGGITTAPAEQGSPLIELLPIAGASIVPGSAGETAAGGGWTTVFPLSIGLVVFPLRSGLLVFCASAIVMVAVTPMMLRPISATRFSAMFDLQVVAATPMKY